MNKTHLLTGTSRTVVTPYRPHPVAKKARHVESIQQMTRALTNMSMATQAAGVALKSVVQAINLDQIARMQRRAVRIEEQQARKTGKLTADELKAR